MVLEKEIQLITYRCQKKKFLPPNKRGVYDVFRILIGERVLWVFFCDVRSGKELDRIGKIEYKYLFIYLCIYLQTAALSFTTQLKRAGWPRKNKMKVFLLFDSSTRRNEQIED